MWKNTIIKVFLSLVITRSINGYELEEKSLFPRLTNIVEYSGNELCKAQTQLYKAHLENLTLWAYEMWDASAKSPVGLLRGNIFQMGDYDECLTIDGPYRTQYCLATISANVPSLEPPRDPKSIYYDPFEKVQNKMYKTEDMSVQSRHAVNMGLCIPAACSPTDLKNSLNEYLSKTEFTLDGENVTYSANVVQDMCQTDADQKKYDSWDIAFCLLSLIIILLVVSSTFYDYYNSSDGDERNNRTIFSTKIYLAFSARKNFLDLSKIDELNQDLRILHGVKVFSLCMIIVGHRFITSFGAISNFDYIEKEYRNKHLPMLLQGNLLVDTFFVLGGLLVIYGLLVQFEKKVFNPLFIILLRYIRLTPAYSFVIFFWATMLNHIGSGPLWKVIVQPEVIDCRKNWWTNLLYINNYVNEDHMCMVHAWYLPCDFHYFIIGIIVALVLNKNKRLGLTLLALLFVLSIIIPFVLTVVYLRPALLLLYPPVFKEPRSDTNFRQIYTKSHIRAVSYIIGMIAGYIYYRLKSNGTHKRLSRMSSHALSLGSVLLLIGCIAPAAVFYDQYHEYNVIEAGAYAALHRAAWGVGTIGVLFSASHGHATVLKSVFSWSPWIPLGKLVYGAYLIHMSFQFRSAGTTMSPKYFSYFELISLALGDITLAFIVALFLYLGIESPIRKIFKELLTPVRRGAPDDKKLASETTIIEENGGHNSGL